MYKTIKMLSLILFLFLISSFLQAGEIKKIELPQLDGNWVGSGSFLLPGVRTKIEITGKAKFRYNKKTKKLRTSLTGEKFMFTYSDSGYLYIDPVSDSVSWEVWDNRNKHALYHGIRKGNKIIGKRMRGKEQYELVIKQVTIDKIEFKLLITLPNGDVYDKATFNLRRVK